MMTSGPVKNSVRTRGRIRLTRNGRARSRATMTGTRSPHDHHWEEIAEIGGKSANREIGAGKSVPGEIGAAWGNRCQGKSGNRCQRPQIPISPDETHILKRTQQLSNPATFPIHPPRAVRPSSL